jgi:hypothetical protein
MTIYCERRSRRHYAAVDLAAVVTEYGEHFALSGFVARSRCSRCGARYPEVSIWVVPNNAPDVIARQRPE